MTARPCAVCGAPSVAERVEGEGDSEIVIPLCLAHLEEDDEDAAELARDIAEAKREGK